MVALSYTPSIAAVFKGDHMTQTLLRIRCEFVIRKPCHFANICEIKKNPPLDLT